MNKIDFYKRNDQRQKNETKNNIIFLSHIFLYFIRTIPNSKLIKQENKLPAISTLNKFGIKAIPYKTSANTVANKTDLLNTFNNNG